VRSLSRSGLRRRRHVIDTNITGTIYLIQKVGRDMRARGEGRILVTGSIAGFMPGTYQAVYNGTKAFIDSFSFALRAELKGSGVTVTCLMPGATETDFFERADMLDTKVGTQKKDDPASRAPSRTSLPPACSPSSTAKWPRPARQRKARKDATRARANHERLAMRYVLRTNFVYAYENQNQ
jgi:short-subunit dehydrogenase